MRPKLAYMVISVLEKEDPNFLYGSQGELWVQVMKERDILKFHRPTMSTGWLP